MKEVTECEGKLGRMSKREGEGRETSMTCGRDAGKVRGESKGRREK